MLRIATLTSACLAAIGIAAPTAPAQSPFGFQAGEEHASLSSHQAGAHADLSTSFKLNAETDEFPEGGTLKDLTVVMPQGFSGSAVAAPTCTEAQLFLSECPKAAEVGTLDIEFFQFGTLTEDFGLPVYYLTPSPGATAEFGSDVGALFDVVFKTKVRSGDYRLVTEARDNPDLFPVGSAGVTLWGIPADHNGGGDERRAILTNPPTCMTPTSVDFSADSWQAQGQLSTEEVVLPPFTGCAALPELEPRLSLAPGMSRASQPSGFDIDLEVPQVENPDGVDTPPVRKVTTTLPKGIQISPPAADGLEACSDAQVGFQSAQPVVCPDASKVGTVSIETPALEKPLSGAMYIGEPKPGDQYRLILVAEGPGVTIKLPGSVEANRETGQLTTTFDDTPQLPFSALHVHLKGGSHALLTNPPGCGTYAATATLTPYGGGPSATAASSFAVDSGCGDAGFSPDLHAGAVDAIAGAFSPFVVQADRNDGEQNVQAIDVALPRGELAKLAGVSLCPETLAASGDCPGSSQVGRATVATGSGPTPLWLPQPGKASTAVYLGGPYAGAPYSIVVKVPAQAGPYDLGTVTVRSGVYIDPETTQVTVKSDPLPQILEGIPIAYRTVHVDIDREAFMRNPTNCEPMSVDAAIRSTSGSLATPSDRFQVSGCRDLGFKPKLSLRLFGATHRGVHPGLRAVLGMPADGANIAQAAVTLPATEFLDQEHIDGVCSRAEFAAEACPAASVYGHAVAKTPLLDEPLRGPVYLRSSGRELPDLVADLRGQIHVVLDGRIDSLGSGAMRTVFPSVPDAPVSRFVLTMRGGHTGLLQNTSGVCRRTQRAIVSFKGQNGRVWAGRPAVRNGCPSQRGRR